MNYSSQAISHPSQSTTKIVQF
ncbi:hypothetical protein PSHT_10918 [Puccinia striiformis]|uniref:Uncharacterized protein n=1 Tax=Puccinia striiformis TaxID=27350 RepID=A0A2S4V6N1_9BASI|nr:hypothetical protein PSHT_10918 [Puccinia striiformis]